MVWKEKRVITLITVSLGIFAFAHGILYTRSHMPMCQYTLPQILGSWESREVQYDHALLTTWLGTDNIVFRTYTDTHQGYRVTLYIAYYHNFEASDKAHEAEVCYPGQGWSIHDNKIVNFTIEGKKMHVKRLAVEKGADAEIVYSWWQTGKSSMYASTSIYHLAQIYKSIVSSDTSSLWVRVSTEIASEQGHQVDSEEVLRNFIQELAPFLALYFP